MKSVSELPAAVNMATPQHIEATSLGIGSWGITFRTGATSDAGSFQALHILPTSIGYMVTLLHSTVLISRAAWKCK